VKVRTNDGRSFAREILHRRASPENPVNWDDIKRKFDTNVARLLAPEAAKRLLELGSRLETLTEVSAINAILAAPFAKAAA